MRNSKFTKKIFVLGVSATLVAGTMVGCSSNKPNNNATSNTTNSTTNDTSTTNTTTNGSTNDTSTDTASSDTTSTTNTAESTDTTTSTDEAATEAQYVKVQSFDGTTVTALKGELPSDATTFTVGTETVTFKVTDTTTISVESENGTTTGTSDQITSDSILEISLDANNNATAVIVKNL